MGKVAAVTGANSGVGFELCNGLLEKGYTVIMLCRSQERGDESRRQLLVRNPGSDLHLIMCDLCSIESVDTAADAVLGGWNQLDLVMANAGGWRSNRSMTRDGVEESFQLNHLGHFHLANRLIPRLLEAEDGRWIATTSAAHSMGSISHLDNPEFEKKWRGMRAYGFGKLCNIWHVRELAKRHGGFGLRAYSFHPGFVRTRFIQDSGFFMPRMLYYSTILATISAKKGAKTGLRIATGDLAKTRNGSYWVKNIPRDPKPQGMDSDAQLKLWRLSELYITNIQQRIPKKNIHDDAVSAIGKTPLIRLNRLTEDLKNSSVWVKLERCNPGGSIKDRIGLQMVLDAEENGLLRPGGTIIEATSGNTGIGLAMVAAQRGYRCIFTIPDKMSQEKIDLLAAMGAEVHVCPTDVEKEDPRSYYEVAARLGREIPNSWYPDQYSHLANPLAHERTTGPEIWEQTAGELTHFVATMGTGGTITGTARALKRLATESGREPPCIVGVDAVGSILKQWFEDGTLGEPHTYKVEGFGEDFIPSATDFSLIDEIHQVDDEACFRWARALSRKEGMFCGGSAGGAVRIALDIAEDADASGTPAKVVVILPDSGNPYLSKFYNDEWLLENGWDPKDWE